MAIKKDYLVVKRNILNEIRSNNMTVQELRFFSIYLSKINPKNIETRIVRFPIEDFQRIMEYKRLNIAQLKSTTNSLLCKVVNMPLERGGYTGFQLFKECTVSRDDNDQWYVEIDAHDKALPLMFEFKKEFFSYQLWNALKLKSPNQLRMYEILKQYEKTGCRIIMVSELRELLGIGKTEYPRFGDFKNRVLDACQKALADYTDISFTYEPYGKKGAGGKILSLKFNIFKNEDYVDQLTLDEFIDIQPEEEPEPERTRHDEIIDLLSDACNNEFEKEQVQLLLNLITQVVPIGITGIGTEHYDYLFHKYSELNYQAKRKKIANRFEYLRSIIKAEVCN
ncbi:replication initiation protein (plasmid) [Oscillospiraceae bacterium PP1C4]